MIIITNSNHLLERTGVKEGFGVPVRLLRLGAVATTKEGEETRLIEDLGVTVASAFTPFADNKSRNMNRKFVMLLLRMRNSLLPILKLHKLVLFFIVG